MDGPQYIKRNLIIMVIEGSLFWGAMAFLEANTVVSVFINDSANSTALAGFAASIRQLMFLCGQIVMGMFIHRLKKPSRFMSTLGFLTRPLILLMLPVLFANVSGPSAAWFFIGLYGLFFFSDGFIGLNWMDIMARTVPPTKRGYVISYQQVVGGLFGLFVGYLVREILGAGLSFKYQYAILFGCAGALLVVDSIALYMIRDNYTFEGNPQPIKRIIPYFSQFSPLFKQSIDFRKITYSRVLYMLAMISAPINVLFIDRLGKLTGSQLSALVMMQVGGQMLGGFTWGRLGDKKGYPFVMLIAQCLGVVSGLLAFVSIGFNAIGLSVLIPMGFMMLITSANTGAWIGFTNHMIMSVPDGKRALYLVLQSITMAPLALSSFLAGSLCDIVGFAPVFGFSLLSAIIGLWYTRKTFIVNK